MESRTQIRHMDLSGVTGLVLAVAFTNTFTFGLGAAIGGTLAGGLCAAICGRWGVTAELIGGAIATALIAVVGPWLWLGPTRRPWVAVLLFVSTAVAAYLVADQLPADREWRLLKWAVTATPFGVFVAAMSDPLRWLRQEGSEFELPWVLALLMDGIEVVVRMIAAGHVGSTVAGAGGGGLGGLIVGFVFKEASEGVVNQFVPNGWTIVWAIVAIGAVAGGINGWWTWSKALAFMAEDEPSPHGSGD
jgi:hypothetical protein